MEQNEKNDIIADDNDVTDSLKINKSVDTPEEDAETTEISEDIKPESLAVTQEILDLMSNEDITSAIENFNTDNEEKEIAVEFAKFHIQYLNEIVENDHNRKISRSAVEIRDLMSHVNIMLRKKDELLFTTVVMHSPAHYHCIQKLFITSLKAKNAGKNAKENDEK